MVVDTQALEILIVDDDELVRGTFVRIFRRGGFKTLEASDGQAGLELFRQRKSDGVLLDLRMPGLDGLDVLSAIVAESPETPVVVASGAGTMHDAVEALRRGAWDFVVKPMFDSELLVKSFERAFEKATLKLQNQRYRENLEHANEVLARALAELRSDQQGARLLQFQLLPRDGCGLGRHSAHRRIFPSQVLSGDFVDYFAIDDNRYGFYIADVSGHGAASAFVTAILTTLVGRYRKAFKPGVEETVAVPERLLERLDQELSGLPLDKHVTIFYGVVDAADNTLRYANAGLFPFPLIKDEGGEVLEIATPGRPLGLPGKGGVGLGTHAFSEGHRLLATTDGILEIGDEVPQRQKREEVRQAFAKSDSIDLLLRRLGLEGQPSIRDDVAILYLGGKEERRA